MSPYFKTKFFLYGLRDTSAPPTSNQELPPAPVIEEGKPEEFRPWECHVQGEQQSGPA